MGEQHFALVRLLDASNQLLGVVIDLPRHVIFGLHDRDAFEQGKRETAAKLREMSNAWLPLAELLNIQTDFASLVSEFEAAVEAIPFYRDLKIMDAPDVLVRDLPWLNRMSRQLSSPLSLEALSPEAQDFAMRLHLRSTRELGILRDALTQEELAVEQQVEYALRLFGAGLDNWWKDHGPKLIRKIRAFQQQLVGMLQSMMYVYLKS